jgi:hypothetical protein
VEYGLTLPQADFVSTVFTVMVATTPKLRQDLIDELRQAATEPYRDPSATSPLASSGRSSPQFTTTVRRQMVFGRVAADPDTPVESPLARFNENRH